jgi:hypothetical protein
VVAAALRVLLNLNYVAHGCVCQYPRTLNPIRVYRSETGKESAMITGFNVLLFVRKYAWPTMKL